MEPKKRALITGITGQDGSYMADFLVSKGYDVHGLIRRSSTVNTERIKHLVDANCITLHRGDVTDSANVFELAAVVQPDEIYHFGAQSHVGASFTQPEYTISATGTSAVRFLEAIRQLKLPTKLYQASSSEMFGNGSRPPQNEATPLRPESPYGISKIMAHHAVSHYRDAYGIFAVSGILFNHESPRRGEEFVTRKITATLAKIRAGLASELVLGNLAARRDWGYAPEYMEAVWTMMQQDRPSDYVIATGETHTVQEFLDHAGRLTGVDTKRYVRTDPSQFRPRDISELRGDASRARAAFGWEPRVRFPELVKIMVEADLKRYGLAPGASGAPAAAV